MLLNVSDSFPNDECLWYNTVVAYALKRKYLCKYLCAKSTNKRLTNAKQEAIRFVCRCEIRGARNAVEAECWNIYISLAAELKWTGRMNGETTVKHITDIKCIVSVCENHVNHERMRTEWSPWMDFISFVANFCNFYCFHLHSYYIH